MKKIIPIVIIIALLGGIGAYAYTRSNTSNEQTKMENDMASMDMGSEATSRNDAREMMKQQESNSIEIRDFAFSPSTVRVKKGTTVTWTNRDNARHDITPMGGTDDFMASELLANGESFSFMFTTAGTYTYKCSPHPYMTGTVEVVE